MFVLYGNSPVCLAFVVSFIDGVSIANYGYFNLQKIPTFLLMQHL